MNLKTILNIILVLGIFDKLRLNKNRKQKNIKENNIKQKNTIQKKDNKKSPSYANINYEYKLPTRKSSRRIKTQSQPKNFSIESTMEWEYCPKCNKKINAVAKKCPYCDYQIITQKDNDYEFDTPISTKYIEKNGFSFNYPEYYDIGAVESKNEVFKTIVGLSKNDDRTCEIYVMEYKISAFNKNVKRNSFLLKENLKMQGYMNVTKNKRLSYCFDAITISQIGKIKTTIKFNFKHNNVIMIVCNRPLHSNYDCIGDIRIINKSVRPKWPKH